MQESLGSLLFDESHFGLELLLAVVGLHHVGFGGATVLDECLLVGLALGEEQLVERRLKMVYLVLGGSIVAVGQFLDTFEYLVLGGIHLQRCSLGIGLAVYCRCRGGIAGFGHGVVVYVGRLGCHCFFSNVLFQDVVLRVHHITV